jgi:hypothetical protein
MHIQHRYSHAHRECVYLVWELSMVPFRVEVLSILTTELYLRCARLLFVDDASTVPAFEPGSLISAVLATIIVHAWHITSIRLENLGIFTSMSRSSVHRFRDGRPHGRKGAALV